MRATSRNSHRIPVHLRRRLRRHSTGMAVSANRETIGLFEQRRAGIFVGAGRLWRQRSRHWASSWKCSTAAAFYNRQISAARFDRRQRPVARELPSPSAAYDNAGLEFSAAARAPERAPSIWLYTTGTGTFAGSGRSDPAIPSTDGKAALETKAADKAAPAAKSGRAMERAKRYAPAPHLPPITSGRELVGNGQAASG